MTAYGATRESLASVVGSTNKSTLTLTRAIIVKSQRRCVMVGFGLEETLMKKLRSYSRQNLIVMFLFNRGISCVGGIMSSIINC